MRLLLAPLALAVLTACGGRSALAPDAGMGPDPQLPPPHKQLIPTLKVAPATGWPAGRLPVAAPGRRVNAFATGLSHPRWLHVLPNGDVLVAETAAQPKPADAPSGGIKGFFMKKAMKKAGSAVPSADRITLLRDADGDGVAETRDVLLAGLKSPFGMALSGDTLFIANTDAIVRVPYAEGATRIDATPEKVVDLPAGDQNRHWTRSLAASPDGSRLYVTVGSDSNVAERGMDYEVERAAVLEVDPAHGSKRIFASGLRNPNGITFEPSTGVPWVVVNERDEIGNDLVPDYMTSVRDGGFYGWPYSYYGNHVDERVQPPRPDLVAKAIVPDYALGAHTASLGLAFGDGGAYIGQHGSWNRKPPSGYKVIFVPFANGRPAGAARDVLTGFLDADGNAMGRPVGVAIDKTGALLVADDVGNTVWRVARASP
jgi:glucose/arabinose dehydrogenase